MLHFRSRNYCCLPDQVGQARVCSNGGSPGMTLPEQAGHWLRALGHKKYSIAR